MDAKQWFAIAAIGRDRPGIVADLSGCIFDCGCNLEDASMTMLGSEFATLLLVSGSGDGLGERLLHETKKLEWERRLTVFVRPLEDAESAGAETAGQEFELTAVGVDRAGLVARIARCLADHGVLITDLRGGVEHVPQSGTPLYTLNLRMSVPATVDREALAASLDEVAAGLNVELAMAPLAPPGSTATS